jgi:hypothetical protein
MEERDKRYYYYTIGFDSDQEGARALRIAGSLEMVYCLPGDVLMVSQRQLDALTEAGIKFKPVRVPELEPENFGKKTF